MKGWSNLCQVAMSVMNMDETVSFYKDLGYVSAGGEMKLKGPIVAKIQNYKGVNGIVQWVSDGSPGFQVEFFHYYNPPARPMALDVRPCDIGYRRLSIWVADFDAVIHGLQTRGVTFVSEPGTYAQGRRACIRDPNGVYLELMEEDIPDPHMKPDRAAGANQSIRTRALTLSVPDLDQALSYFMGILGMERAGATLHTPDMEGLWGLEGAKTKSSLLWCGDFLLELVEYLSPRGKARPEDEQIGDAGIWHAALRFKKGRGVKQAYRQARRAGHHSNSAPVGMGAVTAVYMKTDQGFVFEYFHALPVLNRFFGFP